MRVTVNLSGLHETNWKDYIIRFVFGGAITVITGLIARKFGPVIGGLFLAFPAIFPASATLIEKHERQKKRRAGITDTFRGREAAALDARGASIGTIGLAAFGSIVWHLLPSYNGALIMAAALVAWACVSFAGWVYHGQRRHA